MGDFECISEKKYKNRCCVTRANTNLKNCLFSLLQNLFQSVKIKKNMYFANMTTRRICGSGLDVICTANGHIIYKITGPPLALGHLMSWYICSPHLYKHIQITSSVSMQLYDKRMITHSLLISPCSHNKLLS